MYDAALIFRMRKHFADGFDHSKGFIANDKTGILQSTFFQPDKEVFPALKIFFQAFCRTYDLVVSIIGNSNSHKDGDAFVFLAPAQRLRKIPST